MTKIRKQISGHQPMTTVFESFFCWWSSMVITGSHQPIVTLIKVLNIFMFDRLSKKVIFKVKTKIKFIICKFIYLDNLSNFWTFSNSLNDSIAPNKTSLNSYNTNFAYVSDRFSNPK